MMKRKPATQQSVAIISKPKAGISFRAVRQGRLGEIRPLFPCWRSLKTRFHRRSVAACCFLLVALTAAGQNFPDGVLVREKTAGWTPKMVPAELQLLQRMAQLKSYTVRIGESQFDLMRPADAASLELFFKSSETGREGYKKVAAVRWERLWSLKTNLTYLAEFPGPVPTQLRASVERILIAMTNSTAVSFALRSDSFASDYKVTHWEIGNLNAGFPEDMQTLMGQLEQYPADGEVYVEGLRDLFQAAKGYFGPELRTEALRVYLGFPTAIKDGLRRVLAASSKNQGLLTTIQEAAASALESLDTLWIVTVNAKSYDLHTIDGMEAFLAEANPRTHFVDQLVLFHAVMVEGRTHPELESLATWLARRNSPRFQGFLDSLVALGDSTFANAARQISVEIARANSALPLDGSIVMQPEEPAQAAAAAPAEEAPSMALQARTWLSNHLEITIVAGLLIVAAVLLRRQLSKVKFGRKSIGKEILYRVAEEVMGVIKEKASETAKSIDEEMKSLVTQMRAAQTEFVARDSNRDSLEYLLDRINDLSAKQGTRKADFSDKKLERVIEKDRQGKPALVQVLRESFPRDLSEQNNVTGDLLGAVWANRVLTRNNFKAGEDLDNRLRELQKKAEKFKSLAEIGKNDDHYPAPADVRDAMEAIGVDLRQIIDQASKACTSAWETRYLMNRNPDLVIAAYYKKHFNRFIELAQEGALPGTSP